MAQTLLPQDKNSKREERQRLLAERQKEYTYAHQLGLPIGERYYERDGGGLDWLRKVLVAIYKNRANLEAYLKASGRTFEKPLPEKPLHELAGLLLNKNVVELFNYYLPDLGHLAEGDEVAQSMDDFTQVFQKEPLPAIAKVFKEDWCFGRGFVAGPNPMLLRRLEQPLPKGRFSDDHLRRTPHFAGDSLAQMISDGRAFYVDYAFLTGLVGGKHGDRPKFTGQPIVLLAVPKGQRSLMPVAIQTGQEADSPVLTPADSWSWQMAKTFVRSCDGTYQEVICHLGHTHLVLEPFAVTTRRCLAENHPVHVLLSQHLQGTMPINALAFKKLVLPGQSVDKLVGASIESVYALLTRERLGFSFKQRLVPAELAARGIDDSSRLPDHPYRDDSKQVWQAIRSWVKSYIEYYYPTAEHLQGDWELNNWLKELADPAQGAIKDIGTDGKFASIDELIDTLTLVIFTASAQHAAVNFGQKTDMAFCPAYPLGAFAAPPSDANATEADFMRMLPPIDLALRSEQALVFLGTVQHGRLGHYGPLHFKDPVVIAHMLKFQARLAQLDFSMAERNRSLQLPYIHLMPWRVPQSTNI